MSFLFNKKSPRKILFVAPEVSPFAKAGGLGEVTFALPRALRRLGYDVRIMMPRYASIDPDLYKLTMEYEGLRVPTGAGGGEHNQPEYLICNVKKYTPPADADEERLPVTTYFLENQEYYEARSNIYGYADDSVRWNLLSKGVLEFLWADKRWTPDVIVASDWQTGFLANYLKTEYKDNPRLSGIATIFVIHNISYQGLFDHRFVAELDYDDGQSAIPHLFDERLKKLNGMRRGIMYADVINTVSPAYSREIMTKEFGETLEDLIKERRAHVSGILNGIDYDDFDPSKDPHVPHNFSVKSIEDRKQNKTALQEKFALPEEKNVPILGMVSRLAEQKGFDLLMPVMDSLLKEFGFQFVLVGSGESKYMGYFKDLAERFPKQVSVHLQFDSILPRLIYSGADMILIPSRFEPCGLTQMEAMRYGAIPIVRKTGGLSDSVKDYNPKTGAGTGFVFKSYDSFSMAVAITRAIETYKNPEAWKGIIRQAMSHDLSWEASAQKYTKLFETAIDFHIRNGKKK